MLRHPTLEGKAVELERQLIDTSGLTPEGQIREKRALAHSEGLSKNDIFQLGQRKKRGSTPAEQVSALSNLSQSPYPDWSAAGRGGKK